MILCNGRFALFFWVCPGASSAPRDRSDRRPCRRRSPRVNAEIAEAQDVGTSEREDQEHFRRPDADPLERRQGGDDFLIRHFLQGGEVEAAVGDSFGEVHDVVRLAEARADGLQLLPSEMEKVRCIYCADFLTEPCPDRFLCLRRDLLPDDVMHDGGEYVGVHGTFQHAEDFDDGSEFLVLGFQIGDFLFAAGNIDHESPSYHRAMIRLPRAMRKMPMPCVKLTFSSKMRMARKTAKTTLSLSMGATRETSPVFRAMK